ncbi:hypothetical protein TGME49_257030 [Toxoplasma gondii ME49]|uniref:C4orf27-like protein n=3 Tax=Toxoplasma gondii TaxID=5811 RepID=A0A125YLV7_TOXGV|nr:hypothetical protein TGME49_257030 [Toxoplasma gondii ME49]EPT29234.1 hypothetical protein TGME49_257030 [Toxoplasma gondii ME49]ESS28623.1 putative C4orf27-like protein [Toxoplasma gondii VEG]KYF45744.1 putative C4orf27-like protein [Toxoplasma gondii ARI]|eukprot:XP_018636966.1 hypothetical protein TGME49_257030 [Toxoplasma gondii ME49]
MKTRATRKRSRPAKGSSAGAQAADTDTAATETKMENGSDDSTGTEVATLREGTRKQAARGENLDCGSKGESTPTAGTHGGFQVLSSLREKWVSCLRTELGLTLAGHSMSEVPGSSPSRAGAPSCGVLELWAFCMHLANQRNEDKPGLALEPIGLRLTGVFDLLAEQVTPNDETLPRRGRHFYDLPECLPVLDTFSTSSSLTPEGYHLCLFRDREDQQPHAVVSSVPSEGPLFAVVCADPELLTLPDPPVVSRSVEEPPRKQRGKKTRKAEGLDADQAASKAEDAHVPLLLSAVLLHCDRILAASSTPTARAKNGTKKSRTVEKKTEQRSQDPETQQNEYHVEEAKRIRSALVNWLNAELAVGDASLARIEANTQSWKQKRKKAVVSSDLSGLGVLVPYDAETETGYRSLGFTDSGLRKTILAIKAAPKEERDMQPLDELLNLAGIAMDEGDVGAALHLGRNLFLLDAPNEKCCRMLTPAKLLLRSAYYLLEQPHFAQVVEVAAEFRAENR